jgi:hypothetical protein
MTATDYVKEPLEIMEGSVIDVLPNDATKDTIRVQYIGQAKVMTWTEYAEDIRKREKKKAKAKIKAQLTKGADERKTEVQNGDDNETEEETFEEETEEVEEEGTDGLTGDEDNE